MASTRTIYRARREELIKQIIFEEMGWLTLSKINQEKMLPMAFLKKLKKLVETRQEEPTKKSKFLLL